MKSCDDMQKPRPSVEIRGFLFLGWVNYSAAVMVMWDM